MIAIRNLTLNEMLRKAANDDNELALAIYDGAEEELRGMIEAEMDVAESSDFPHMDGSEIFEILDTVLKNPEWNKMDDGYYVLKEFHEDTNVYSNHVAIIKDPRARKYDVVIKYAALGESDKSWAKVGGLAEAKDFAVREAIRLVCNGELNC